jgi:hypothetical protein
MWNLNGAAQKNKKRKNAVQPLLPFKVTAFLDSPDLPYRR